jgi:carboxylesterase
MTDFYHDKGSRPFFFRGGSTGCLLIHGFTGQPGEMRWLGDYLAAQRHTVLGVRLNAHGTTPADLNQSTWPHWLGSAADGLHILRDQCERVFVIGLSMGGMTAINLAARFSLDGAVVMSTPVLDRNDWRLRFADQIALFKPYMKKKPHRESDIPLESPDRYSYPVWPIRAVKQFYDYAAETRQVLPGLTTPTLVVHSHGDDFITKPHADYLFSNLGSKDKEMLWLQTSGHVVTEGPERAMLFEHIQSFITTHSR